MRTLTIIAASLVVNSVRTLVTSPCMSLKYIPSNKLGVSEPNPSWFGNSPNELTNPNWTNKNWLISRFHFSFAEYSNPRNVGFGVLRVMNDDLVQPNRGFGTHPHKDVEICTYIVDGGLTHKDSMGTSETLSRGAIQFMTAGTGVNHSEHNLDPTNPLRFIQIWINTRQKSLKPNYGSFVGEVDARQNKWAHLVADVASNEKVPIKINQDANIFVTEVSHGNTVNFEIKQGRQAYLLCIDGSVNLSTESGNAELLKHDAAELVGPLTFRNSPTGSSPAHLLIVEMEASGTGRTDVQKIF
jgi:redox-sensitive bicupin YhaK (pirin superfamily)